MNRIMGHHKLNSVALKSNNWDSRIELWNSKIRIVVFHKSSFKMIKECYEYLHNPTNNYGAPYFVLLSSMITSYGPPYFIYGAPKCICKAP